MKCEHVFLNAQIHAKINMKNVLDSELWKLMFSSVDFVLRGFGKQKWNYRF